MGRSSKRKLSAKAASVASSAKRSAKVSDQELEASNRQRELQDDASVERVERAQEKRDLVYVPNSGSEGENESDDEDLVGAFCECDSRALCQCNVCGCGDEECNECREEGEKVLTVFEQLYAAQHRPREKRRGVSKNLAALFPYAKTYSEAKRLNDKAKAKESAARGCGSVTALFTTHPKQPVYRELEDGSYMVLDSDEESASVTEADVNRCEEVEGQIPEQALVRDPPVLRPRVAAAEDEESENGDKGKERLEEEESEDMDRDRKGERSSHSSGEEGEAEHSTTHRLDGAGAVKLVQTCLGKLKKEEKTASVWNTFTPAHQQRHRDVQSYLGYLLKGKRPAQAAELVRAGVPGYVCVAFAY
jgi:hypothetical protein